MSNLDQQECSRCSEPRLADRTLCIRCAARQKEKGERYRQKQVVAGLCNNGCGNHRIPNRTLCVVCNDKNKAHSTKWRMAAKAKGLCEHFCNRPSLPGKSLCFSCSDKRIWYQIKRKFGLTRDQWIEIYNVQNGKCAICFKDGDIPSPLTARTKILVVDHCHREGAVRALLCDTCNLLLGYANDSRELLSKASHYLEQHGR